MYVRMNNMRSRQKSRMLNIMLYCPQTDLEKHACMLSNSSVILLAKSWELLVKRPHSNKQCVKPIKNSLAARIYEAQYTKFQI